MRFFCFFFKQKSSYDMPISDWSSDVFSSDLRGLLFVNHEYTNEEVMFPGLTHAAKGEDPLARMTAEHVGIEMAAHGASVVEVTRDPAGKWGVVQGSRFNRRITTAATEIRVAGPAAGHPRMRTAADQIGRAHV